MTGVITAEEAREMRNTPYRLEEIMRHVESVAADSGRVYGYKATRMPEQLLDQLRSYGYTVTRDDEGEIEISW